MTEFQPTLPPHWKVYPPGPILIEDAMWDEDLYGGEWNGLAIWLDGGKGLSVFQCRIVILAEPNAEGVLEHDHETMMRDFFDTPEQVCEWIIRAVGIAEKLHAERAEDGRWPKEG